MNLFSRLPSQEFSLARPTAAAESAPQTFGRFEFKYFLRPGIRSQLEGELGDFMEVDPFCRERPGRAYRVRSLYFDDPGFSNYYEKIDGLLSRRKFRLRTYDVDGSAPCFLELKGRENHFSYKLRSRLDARQRELIEARSWSRLAQEGAGPVFERFVVAACRGRLEPKVVVDYRRRPYVSFRDYRFRATFDDEIRGTERGILEGEDGRSADVLPGLTVLEVKFEHALPVWFQRLIGAYELQRVSISKYCRAAEALTLVENLE